MFQNYVSPVSTASKPVGSVGPIHALSVQGQLMPLLFSTAVLVLLHLTAMITLIVECGMACHRAGSGGGGGGGGGWPNPENQFENGAKFKVPKPGCGLESECGTEKKKFSHTKLYTVANMIYYLPITFTPIRKEGVYFHITLFPKAKRFDFVTKLSHIHGNIMRTNQVTGNIIVSTCCLGDMAVNAPESEGAARGLRGIYSHITLTNMC